LCQKTPTAIGRLIRLKYRSQRRHRRSGWSDENFISQVKTFRSRSFPQQKGIVGEVHKGSDQVRTITIGAEFNHE
jgi:hypothetical protein